MLISAELNVKFEALSKDHEEIKKALFDEMRSLKAHTEVSLKATLDEVRAIVLGRTVGEKFIDIDLFSSSIHHQQQYDDVEERDIDIVEGT